jgi:hypothetical protein
MTTKHYDITLKPYQSIIQEFLKEAYELYKSKITALPPRIKILLEISSYPREIPFLMFYSSICGAVEQYVGKNAPRPPPKEYAQKMLRELRAGWDLEKNYILNNPKLQELIDKNLHSLKEKERKVIEMRFGLKDGKSYTFKDIGKKLDFTKQNAERTKNIAIKNLRDIGEFDAYLKEQKMNIIDQLYKRNKLSFDGAFLFELNRDKDLEINSLKNKNQRLQNKLTIYQQKEAKRLGIQPDIFDTQISELDLPTRIKNALLRRYGSSVKVSDLPLNNLESLIDNTSENRLTNFGETYLKNLRDALGRSGLNLNR